MIHVTLFDEIMLDLMLEHDRMKLYQPINNQPETKMKRKYGEQAACKYCGQDIEFHGRATGWIDRGANRQCCAYEKRGEIVKPKTKHAPVGSTDWL